MLLPSLATMSGARLAWMARLSRVGVSSYILRNLRWLGSLCLSVATSTKVAPGSLVRVVLRLDGVKGE